MTSIRILLALASVAACAGQQAARGEMLWPQATDHPRVRYVRSFARDHELASSFWQRAQQLFVDSDRATIDQVTGLALSPDETLLYAVNGQSSRLSVVDLTRRTIEWFGSRDAPGPPAPFGVAVDLNGRVYVTDTVVRAVWVYEGSGEFVTYFGAQRLVRPTGVAVDHARSLLYVADAGNSGSDRHVVEVFSLAGKHLRTIGARGRGAGQFLFPIYLAVAPTGLLYVGDTLNHRIQIFDHDGSFISMFGERGPGYGRFGIIKGLAFDGFGNIHVVDGEFGLVQVFNRDNVPLMYYGRTVETRMLGVPAAIAISTAGGLYVSNFHASKVAEFTLFNTTLADCVDP